MKARPSVAVCLLHSYANPQNEERVEKIIHKTWPEIAVSLSSHVAREFREYERMSTTVLDAYIKKRVAEKLNRRWIACDLGRFAIHTTRKRLLSIDNVRPFVVQNLGKYERQAWQKAEFGEQADARNQNYRNFILDLYKARPITGYTWLHAVKSGRMVVVPYELGVNDIRVFIRENHTPEQYYRLVCDHFDTLYKDSESGGRVLCLPLHPFVIGMPFRIKYLDKALDYMCSHEGVWRTTGWEIADWYYKHYYKDPGRFVS